MSNSHELHGENQVYDEDTKELVNTETGEIIEYSEKESSLDDIQSQIVKLIPTAGTLELTDKQIEILYDPVNDEDVEIRPDGLIYLPWMEYVTRLRKAFGLKWTIVPQGVPRIEDNLLLWGFYLIIDGKLAGFAYGEQKYSLGSHTMSWGDACEGAKSNALMRLCKGLGISLELWKPSFIKAWKAKNAESYWEYNKYKAKKELKWRKKNKLNNNEKKENNDSLKTNGNNTNQYGWYAFLKTMQTQKKRVGAKAYYTIIGINGFEKSNQIKNRTIQKKIYRELLLLPDESSNSDNLTETKQESPVESEKNYVLTKEEKNDKIPF